MGVAGGCTLMLLTGCTSSENSNDRATTSNSVGGSAAVRTQASQAPSVPAGTAQVPCGSSIAAESDPPTSYQVIAHDVAVPTIVLQASESGETDPALHLFAKWGLVVRAGVAVDLQVAPGWEDRARIGWGRPGSPAVAVHVPACPVPSGQAVWLHFAGGTWVARPACVPLMIRSQGQETQVRLGVGVPCAADGSP